MFKIKYRTFNVDRFLNQYNKSKTAFLSRRWSKGSTKLTT